MALTQSNSGLDVVLEAGRTVFHQTVEHMRSALARRKIYNETYAELSSLTDRDLHDLGIVRSNIKKIALEAANGH